MTIKQKEFYLPFIKKEVVAKGTYSFYFSRIRAHSGWDFLPGQYVQITLDIQNPDRRGASKVFTIASSPLQQQHIMITTKIIRSSFKKKLMELVPGEKVKFSGPFGGFVLNEEEKDRRVFLAGGIGITPFHSMIKFADQKHLSIPIILLVSFSTAADVFWQNELLSIAKRNSNIKIIYTVSRPEESSVKWEGETGRISKSLIRKYVLDFLKPQYFIVGPPAMVAAMEEVVKNMGVETKKIFIENFTGY